MSIQFYYFNFYFIKLRSKHLTKITLKDKNFVDLCELIYLSCYESPSNSFCFVCNNLSASPMYLSAMAVI